MGKFEIFANVIVITPPDKAEKIYAETPATLDRKRMLATGITTLPNDAGLLFKVLGCDTGLVKQTIREFCSRVRMAVKGKPLPAEFLAITHRLSKLTPDRIGRVAKFTLAPIRRLSKFTLAITRNHHTVIVAPSVSREAEGLLFKNDIF